MKKIFLPTTVICTLLLAGCNFNSYKHSPPDKITIDNEKFINKSTNNAWSDVANIFFNDIFKLETSDKTTSTIVATFKTDRPINYIDCGVVKRSYMDNKKVTHEYTYNYADTTDYGYEEDDQFYEAKVTTSLFAEITAKVAPRRKGSVISVNTNYTLTRKTISTNLADGTELPPVIETIKFTTTEPYKTEAFSCTSNSAIENTILDNLQ